MGTSLKRFDGWEPATEYQHDDAGRLVRSVPETEWDEQERGWMLALEAYRQSRCDRCGGDLDEGIDPKNEDRYHHLAPLQCFRCLEFARAEKQYEDQPYAHTLMHRVELRR